MLGRFPPAVHVAVRLLVLAGLAGGGRAEPSERQPACQFRRTCGDLGWLAGAGAVCTNDEPCARGTFADTQQSCAAQGARLCTLRELQTRAGSRTRQHGCAFKVWTADRCAGGHFATFGDGRAVPVSVGHLGVAGCLQDDANGAAMLCCSDADLPLPRPQTCVGAQEDASQNPSAAAGPGPLGRRQPNILLFVADDLSRGDLSFYGNDQNPTPNVDAFAHASIELTRMYTPTAMCVPSRSVLYTGMRPLSNGAFMNHGKVHNTVQSLPHHLQPLGYEVALVGKVHVKPAKNFPFTYVAGKKDRLKRIAEYTSYTAQYYAQKAPKPLCMVYASFDPHSPHIEPWDAAALYPEVEFDFPDSVVLPPKWPDTEASDHTYQGTLRDVKMMDIEFGRFMDDVKSHPKMYQDSVIMFTRYPPDGPPTLPRPRLAPAVGGGLLDRVQALPGCLRATPASPPAPGGM